MIIEKRLSLRSAELKIQLNLQMKSLEIFRLSTLFTIFQMLWCCDSLLSITLSFLIGSKIVYELLAMSITKLFSQDILWEELWLFMQLLTWFSKIFEISRTSKCTLMALLEQETRHLKVFFENQLKMLTESLIGKI